MAARPRRKYKCRVRPSVLLRLAVVFAAYVVSARAGLAVDAVGGFATLVWAPTGIALAAMLLWGFGVWPAVALGAAVVNAFAGAPLPVALVIAAGNTAEALAGTWLLRAVRFDARLQRLSDVLGLILLAAVAALVSASVGVLALRLGGLASAELTGRAWRTWWVGDVMGAVVVTPAILIWWKRPPIRKRRHVLAEAALAMVVVGTTVALVFGTRRAIAELRVPSYVLFPVLLAVATRFGQYGAATANLAVSAAAIAITALGYGPFVRSAGLSENLLQLQMLMGILSITTLVLGAAVAERDRAVEAREDFLSVASHELRTPLTSLSLQLQLLFRALEGRGAAPSSERMLSTVNAAVRQSRKLGRLIGDLLDVSRITAGQLQLEPEEIDLGALVREVAGSYEEQFRSGGFSISITCEGNCLGFWDRERLEQVVDNLFSNAIKYGDGKPIDVRVSGTAEGVTLSVRDRGIGVSSDDQRRIFDQFARGTSGRRYAGLGLGLWIARRIVEAHLGRIRVESAPGAGTTFVVDLQREPIGRGRAPTARPSPQDNGEVTRRTP
jgi:signal transduction histidine kinase